jgi:alpha-L-fucosidase
MIRPRLLLLCALLSAALSRPVPAADDPTIGSLNRPERLEWFRDQGFGLFIHWSVDSQLGTVISHSLVGASDDYARRFFEELPRTFNPRKFAPTDWAVLAKLAGVRYVMLTAKHHSGFCLWPTATTDFDIAHTPFKRDVVGEVLAAFRAQGIAPGLYFSPDDFWWLYKHGKDFQRHAPDVIPANNPGLLAHDQAQIRELLTNYGDIDLFFIDGEPQGLREKAWELQPSIVVTRGAIQTPEQFVPGVPLDGVWEANLTMGRAWQYQPTNENYKSGGQCISLLVETRAKGGNLLLNVGPKPDGELPIEQEERLREVALWMFINSECIYDVRPWVITNEGDLWFTKRKDADTLYVIVKTAELWPYGQNRTLDLKSVRATEATEVSVLGQNGRVIEYRPTVSPKATWTQDAAGLHVTAMQAQRIYDDRRWPNPVVLKLTHVQPALTPPLVRTVAARWDAATRKATLAGQLVKLGDAATLRVGFEYRDVTGLDANEGGAAWVALATESRSGPGDFAAELGDLAAGHVYDVRAVARHPLLPLYGATVRLRVP